LHHSFLRLTCRCAPGLEQEHCIGTPDIRGIRYGDFRRGGLGHQGVNHPRALKAASRKARPCQAAATLTKYFGCPRVTFLNKIFPRTLEAKIATKFDKYGFFSQRAGKS
jgi:hypothetical protein